MTAMRPLEVGRGVFPPHIFLSFFLVYCTRSICMYVSIEMKDGQSATRLLVCLSTCCAVFIPATKVCE